MILLCDLTDSLFAFKPTGKFASTVQFMVVLHLAHYVKMNGCYERGMDI